MARAKTRYYLAYGSNLNMEQMQRRCPFAKVTGTAYIRDYRLLFKGSHTGSYLTIEQAEGYTVPVAVWEVTGHDEANLDVYEGFPTFYYKKDFQVICKCKNGKKRVLDAFAYIMDESRKVGIPSITYMRTCMDGYEAFDFDRDILVKAYIESQQAAV